MLWRGNYVVVAFANAANDIFDVVGNVAAPCADFSVVNDAGVVDVVDDVTPAIDFAGTAPFK